MSDPVSDRLARIEAIQGELETILQTLILNDSTIIDALAQMLGAIQQMQARSEDSQNRVADEVQALARELARLQAGAQTARPAAIEDDNSALEDPDPEIALLQYLYSFIEPPIAIDVGANKGQFTTHLLRTGYTVYAFEPFPPSFGELSRLDGERLHPFQCAVGTADGAMDLHLARNSIEGAHDASLFNSLVHHPMLEDCDFEQSLRVPVRSLESLRLNREIPERVGLLKIDTEGFDLEVVRGMGEEFHPAVVMTEFWDRKHPFGVAGHGALDDLVTEMRRREYPWHLTINHLDGSAIISFSCNRLGAFPRSWGNALFFRQHQAFLRALDWCEQRLKPAAGAAS